MGAVLTFLPLLLVLAISAGGLTLAYRLLITRATLAPDARLGRQVVMILLTGLAIVGVLLVVPVGETTRTQLLGLFGLVLTAMITLSSTTFVANAMAGVMLRAVSNFRVGDFVRVGEQFGRVTERGLFHTEVQTEDRDLATLPNLYLVTHPVTVVHASGTIVSTSLSLGYDVPNGLVIPHLLRAATAAGLADPFVHVTNLGDFAVSYRVAGFLADVKPLLSVRSRLRISVLDTLHAAGIEVASPSLMDQRRLAEGHVIVPPAREPHVTPPKPAGTGAEAIVFDKADRAEDLQRQKVELDRLDTEIASVEEEITQLDGVDRRAGEARLESLRVRRQRLQLQIAAGEQRSSPTSRPHPRIGRV